MSIVVRCGSMALLIGFVAIGTPVRAEDKPADGSATPVLWTDPPVRGAAAPDSARAGKIDEHAAPSPSAERMGPSEAAKNTSTAAKEDTAESSAEPAQARPIGSARLRHDQIRRGSAGPSREQSVAFRKAVPRANFADRSAPTRSSHSSPASRRIASRDLQDWTPVRQVRRRDMAALRDGYRPVRRFEEIDPFDSDAGPSPYRAARWRNAFAQDPAERIAAERAAGYLEMRSRSYGYSDGMRARRFQPFYLEDPGGLD